MTENQEREIRLSVRKSELIQLLEALAVSNFTELALKVNQAWPGESETSDAQLSEGLSTIRTRLFNLKGYLESTGYPRVALSWIDEAVEVVTSLQTMGE